MKMKYVFLNVSFFCLISLASVTTSASCLTLKPFNKIELNGTMQVQIVADQSESNCLSGDALSNQQASVKFTEHNQILKVKQSGKTEGKGPTLLIHAPVNLASLTVNGNSIVNVTKLHSPDFTLIADNQGEINVKGVVGLKKLVAKHGVINVYWLDTSSLAVFANGNSQILLGGKVGNLHASCKERSSLNARYLRVNKAYLSSDDSARIDISAREVLEAQAAGHSNIYFYQKPKFIGQYMTDAGSILNVVGEPMVQE